MRYLSRERAHAVGDGDFSRAKDRAVYDQAKCEVAEMGALAQHQVAFEASFLAAFSPEVSNLAEDRLGHSLFHDEGLLNVQLGLPLRIELLLLFISEVELVHVDVIVVVVLDLFLSVLVIIHTFQVRTALQLAGHLDLDRDWLRKSLHWHLPPVALMKLKPTTSDFIELAVIAKLYGLPVHLSILNVATLPGPRSDPFRANTGHHQFLKII